MLGYEKGYRIKIEDQIVHLNKSQIQEVANYNEICKTQQYIQSEYRPNKYDDNTAFDLAEAAVSLSKTQNIIIEDAIKWAEDDGFFPQIKP